MALLEKMFGGNNPLARGYVEKAIDESSPIMDALCDKLDIEQYKVQALLGLAIHDGVISVDALEFGDLAFVYDQFGEGISDYINECVDYMCNDWMIDCGEIVNDKWIVGCDIIDGLRENVKGMTTDEDMIECLCEDEEIADGETIIDVYFGKFDDATKKTAFDIIRKTAGK